MLKQLKTRLFPEFLPCSNKRMCQNDVEDVCSDKKLGNYGNTIQKLDRCGQQGPESQDAKQGMTDESSHWKWIKNQSHTEVENLLYCRLHQKPYWWIQAQSSHFGTSSIFVEGQIGGMWPHECDGKLWQERTAVVSQAE